MKTFGTLAATALLAAGAAAAAAAGAQELPAAARPSAQDPKPQQEPEADRDAMLTYGNALQAGDLPVLELFWEYEDDLDREFGRKLARLCARTDGLRAELVTMRRLAKEGLFACFLVRGLPLGFEEDPWPMMQSFARRDDRWRGPAPNFMRTIILARTLSANQFGRRSACEQMVALRNGSSAITELLGPTAVREAQAEAYQLLSEPPYDLDRYRSIAETMRRAWQGNDEERQRALQSVHSWQDLVRLYGDELKSMVPEAGDFSLSVYLEAATDDPYARALPLAAGEDSFRAELFPCLTDRAVSEATVVEAGDSGRAAIDVRLTRTGARWFHELTKEAVGRRVAFVVDGEVVAAPTIAAPVSGDHARIDGGFTPEQAAALAEQLNAYRRQALAFLDDFGQQILDKAKK